MSSRLGCDGSRPNAAAQDWDPARYATSARFVSELGMPVLELLGPRPGERVLDLGCGDGALTTRLEHSGCKVVAVDASSAMVEAARARGLDVRLLDGQALTFDAEFDAVFSNAALHWMPDAVRVATGVFRALKPGGRFVGEFGGRGNVATIVAAVAQALGARGREMPSPWYFPSSAEYRAVLEAQGFAIDSIASFPRPTPLPGDVGEWIETLAQPFLRGLAESERQTLLRDLVATLRKDLCDAQGRWVVDYVRLRFAARKPAIASR
jgi:trans-aconitate methyltransferase